MTYRKQLFWVQENRRTPRSPRQAGNILQELAHWVCHRKGPSVTEIASAVSGLIDEEFHKHCRIVDVRGQRLSVEVDAPTLAYPMRLRWSAPLLEILRTVKASPPIAVVDFTFGLT